MKSAAVLLGVIGGIIGMFTGFFAFGWVEFTSWVNREAALNALDQPDNARLLQVMGLIAPILAIAGGAMSKLRPYIGAVLMLASAAGMFWAFGFGAFTMFPIAMCATGGILGMLGALSGEPDGMK